MIAMKLQFTNVGKAMKAIWELETELGLERSDAILNIKKANARYDELAAMRGSRPKPVAVPISIKSVASVTPPPPPAPKLTRRQCERIMSEVFWEAPPRALSDADLLEDVTARLTAEKLRCDALGLKAGETPSRNIDRIIRGRRQESLDAILRSKQN